jgi:hypothetical protein
LERVFSARRTAVLLKVPFDFLVRDVVRRVVRRRATERTDARLGDARLRRDFFAAFFFAVRFFAAFFFLGLATMCVLLDEVMHERIACTAIPRRCRVEQSG